MIVVLLERLKLSYVVRMHTSFAEVGITRSEK